MLIIKSLVSRSRKEQNLNSTIELDPNDLSVCQVRHQWEEGGRVMTEHLPLLQLWLGLATSLGSLLGGLLTIPRSRHLFISNRLLVQLSMMGAALAMFSLYCVTGYYG